MFGEFGEVVCVFYDDFGLVDVVVLVGEYC